MALTIFCGWCGKHEFKVDPATGRDAGILKLECPKCRKVTSISARDDGTVLPDSPPSAGVASSAADSPEQQMVSLAREAEQCLARNEVDKTFQALQQLAKVTSQVNRGARQAAEPDSRRRR